VAAFDSGDICIGITVMTTLAVNVPINTLTAQWQPGNNPAEWSQMRARWHFFQGIRGGLFMAAFALLAVASAVGRQSSSVISRGLPRD
jgi:uncharacterized membrane protein